MQNGEVEILRDYESLVFDRTTTRDPRWVALRDINWADQPSRFKIYRGVERRQLDRVSPEPMASFASAIQGEHAAPQPLTYQGLSRLLYYTNGILGRRMDLNWNQDLLNRTICLAPAHARPAASGGGMYPFELYWVAGAGGPVTPGIYHYDNAHASLSLLRTGDCTGAVRGSLLGYSDAGRASDFLLVSINFWKTSFKYASFTYHIVTQDMGSCLATVHLTARAERIRARTLHWFADEPLNRLLGLDTLLESVFAVIAIEDPARPAGAPQTASVDGGPGKDVARTSFQRSWHTIRFPLVEQAHQAAILTEEVRPDLTAAPRAGVSPKPPAELSLPKPRLDLLDQPLDRVYRSRHSSFGAFTGLGSISVEDLATLLHCGAAAQTLRCDVKDDNADVRFTRLALFAARVDGVPAGVYSYDTATHGLTLHAEGSFGLELQRLYFLENYNLEQAAVVFLIFGDLDRVFAVYGNRGLRILNAEVGSTVQCLYLACAALGLGSGAMLGFENNRMRGLARLDDSDDPLLLFAAGPELTAPYAFDYQLY